MAVKGSQNIRHRIITNFEYMQAQSPSKLAQYLRTRLAHNQGCPPVPLMQVFTMCGNYTSCDECWWGWLCAEHVDEVGPMEKREARPRCWTCRWGVIGDNAHPIVHCMNKKFYGVTLDADDYCSFYTERRVQEPKRSDAELALRLGELREENQEEVGDVIRRRYELKQLARELERRRREKELLGEEDGAADGGTGEGAAPVLEGEQPPGVSSPTAQAGG